MSKKGRFPAGLLAVLAVGVGAARPVAARGKIAGREDGAVVLEASPAVAAAVRGLGPGVGFYTSSRHPLVSLAAVRRPGLEVASPHLQLGRGVLGLLRAGGAPIDPGATALMTLLGERQLAGVFGGASPVELLLLREGDGGGAEAIEKAGGRRVLFRETASGKMLGAPGPTNGPAKPEPPPAGLQTSFGPLLKAERTDKARQRQFEPTEVKVEIRTPHARHQFVKLNIARDFSRGLGTVSFLYGSGIIVEANYDRLQIEADGKRLRPAAVFDAGPNLELAYEVPATAKRLLLIDGDARLPLTF
jgi:hypothetical protein